VERLDLEPSWQSHLPEDQLLQFFVKPALLGHSLKDAANVKIPAGKSCFVLEMSGTRSRPSHQLSLRLKHRAVVKFPCFQEVRNGHLAACTDV
jgi:hypothetical protein